jgi:hypothetical protein
MLGDYTKTDSIHALHRKPHAKESIPIPSEESLPQYII